jgi:pimeloyl-ACP methyl ester carboxylesterase
MVLLHGIGSDAESWVPVMTALDPAIEVIAWDAPGYGGSEALTEAAPGPGDYVDRLAAFLDGLGLDRVVLVGHSLGCLFAARFAVAYPGRVAAVGLLSPALGYGVAADEALPASVQARIDDLVAFGAVEFAAKRAARLVHRAAEKPAVLAGVRRAMAAVRLPGYAQAVRALGGGTLLADAARIAAPTLVAVGAEDVITPPANARAVWDALRHGVALEIVTEAGHALPQEAPARVAQLITEEIHV